MRIGVDVGGTKIEVLAIDESGTELMRLRRGSPPGDYGATLAVIKALVDEVEDHLQTTGTVGLGTPGAIDPVTGLLKNSNSTALNGKPFDVDIAATLGREIRMANDADCLAVSEAHDGAAAAADPVFAVILGTGVGGGLVANGRLVSGPNRIAGEWGHIPLPWPRPDEIPGPQCYCGKRGCVETFLAGPGLANDHAKRTGHTATAREIVDLAQAGDEEARATLAIHHDRLARGLAVVINIVDPEVVVLGGGVSNIDSIYDVVPSLLPQYVFSGIVLTRLARAEHGDSSGVRGAAWLWSAGLAT